MSAGDKVQGNMATGPSINEGNIIEIPLQTLMASIATGDLLTAFVPGFNFVIRKVWAIINAAVTTGSKAATLTPSISGVNCVGGVLTLSGTYAMGKYAAGTAMDTSDPKNQGSNTDSISLTASSVTTFVEGSGTIFIELQNLDVLA